MNSSIVESFELLCRICLKSKRKNIEIKNDLKKWFQKYLEIDIEMEENTEYPKIICSQCYVKLQDFHNLFLMAIESNHFLNLKLNESTSQGGGGGGGGDRDAIEAIEHIVAEECTIEPINGNEPQTGKYLNEATVKSENPIEENSSSTNVPRPIESKGTLARKRVAASIKRKSNKKKKNLESDDESSFSSFSISDNSDDEDYKVKKKKKQESQPPQKVDATSEDVVARTAADPLEDGDEEKSVQEEFFSSDSETTEDDEEEEDLMPIAEPEKTSRGKIHCPQCPRRFRTEENLSNHMRIHEGLKPFQCTQCERSFMKKANLKMHIVEVHTDQVIEYICNHDDCGRKFNKKSTFDNHVRKKHKNKPVIPLSSKPKTLICEDCGQSFSCLFHLKEHRYRHLPFEERPFKCDQCPQRFVTKRSLKEHLLRHSGVKNFQCQYCGLKKTTRRELRVHTNYHTKEKQYPCKLCPMIFNSSGNLKKHDRVVHRLIRAYKCQYCELSFGKKDTLKHHEMRHTGEKPHQCEICKRRFIQSVSLRAHLKTHSKGEAKANKEEKAEEDSQTN